MGDVILTGGGNSRPNSGGELAISVKEKTKRNKGVDWIYSGSDVIRYDFWVMRTVVYEETVVQNRTITPPFEVVKIIKYYISIKLYPHKM